MTAPALAAFEPNARGMDHCPAHEDTHRSLSVKEAKDGKLLLRCFVGCSFADILAAKGLSPADAFAPDLQALPHTSREPLATYDYLDADGRLAYRVKRYHDKRFAMLRPDGSAIGATPRVPYRLPEILASDRGVVIVEGEKDADRLASLGILATTNAGGAGHWLADWARYFRGRRVAIIPDDDEPGRKHAASVAASLRDVAREVRIVTLPDLPARKGADTTDWLDAGHDAHELRAILADAPIEPTGLPTVYTVGDLAALPSADEEYVIGGGILTRGGKLLLYGKAGAGKTTLLDFLAGPLATGRPFLGRYAIDRPYRVLVVQGELSLSEMASHAQALVSAGFDDGRLMFARMTDLKLPAGEATLARLVETTGAEVLILDPWYRLFAGESSDKPEQVGTVFDACDRLLDSGAIVAVVIAHHANVSGLRTAGSWMFEGWPSTIVRLDAMAGLPDQRKVTFEKVRAPGSDLLNKSVVVRLGEAGYLPLTLDTPTATAGAIMAVQIVREAGGQLHRQELIARLMARAFCQQRAAAKYLGQACQGELEAVPDGKSKLYRVRVEAEA